MAVFGITNSEEFYALLVADFDDFCLDRSSSRLAVHCAISSFHMAEWVWSDWLKNDTATRAKMGIGKSRDEFLAWIDSHSVWFQIVQGIANGSKHVAPQGFATEAVREYGQGPYGVGPWSQEYLLIDWGEGVPADQRYQTAGSVLEVVVRFWRDFLRLYRPDPARIDSKNHTM